MTNTAKDFSTKWNTPIGRDCVDLHSTLARWLGERLIFLADNAQGYPARMTFDEWTHKLRDSGLALLAYAMEAEDAAIERDTHRAAQTAMMFVTRNLGNLWD